jgi:signal transduction histidine kinase
LTRLQSAVHQANAATESKSRFLANVSHEIRTPLGAIMGFLDLIKINVYDPDEILKYSAVIERNSSQLLRLIDDILDLSKVEAGQISIENIEFSLINLIADCVSLMGFRAREKGIGFALKLDSKLPVTVCSDPTRIRQILNNVIGNAIKFTERGGVELTVAFADGLLTLKVQDTGRGISEQQRVTLFRAFQQADDSITRLFGGTGLGLILTRNLAEAMGGSFELAQSQLGEGSTFVVRLKMPLSADI